MSPRSSIARLVPALALCLLACHGHRLGKAHHSTTTPLAARSPDVVRKEGNHLSDAGSLYLRLHAHNPVDWYPWSEETLARARKTGAPIFLSIGYASCHWCHVMEAEVFEDDAVASFLNAHFVSIKVDREERPDLDATYMALLQSMTGGGGWPMSMFLTPSLTPFFGATYLPKQRFLSAAKSAWDEFSSKRSEVSAKERRSAAASRATRPRRARRSTRWSSNGSQPRWSATWTPSKAASAGR
jgi:uncharacterized protein YyaL (SSP411 family)